MSYKLYFNQTFVGDIEYSKSDFPSFSGHFSCYLKETDQLSKHIIDYINFSSRQSDFYSKEHTEDFNGKIFEEENQYLDLIKSEKWYLMDEKAEKTLILVPIFNFDNTINWRLNIKE